MFRSIDRRILAAICLIAASTTSALAIETTYGEDPVPNSKCYDGFINLGYGIDPIPAKSPYVRWQEWRANRGLPPTVGVFKRQQGESRFLSSPPEPNATRPLPSPDHRSGAIHPAAQPSGSRRNARTRNLPQSSSVR